MLKVMRRFNDADVELKEIFTFIDSMFAEYPKRRRIKRIDMNWLYGVINIFLRTEDKSDNKVKAPEVSLDDEMKAWLQQEKKKWLK